MVLQPSMPFCSGILELLGFLTQGLGLGPRCSHPRGLMPKRDLMGATPHETI